MVKFFISRFHQNQNIIFGICAGSSLEQRLELLGLEGDAHLLELARQLLHVGLLEVGGQVLLALPQANDVHLRITVSHTWA